MTDDRQVLRELARLYDVQESYRNVHGERVHASVDSMIAVLGAMGAPIASLGTRRRRSGPDGRSSPAAGSSR